MDFKAITDTLDGVSLSEQAQKHNVTKSTMTYRIINAVKDFKKNRHLRSDKETYYAIKFDKNYRDIMKNKDNWNKALKTISSYTPSTELQPVTTIFKATNFKEAFDIASKQSSTLSAYEGALLMYNTLVSNYKVKE